MPCFYQIISEVLSEIHKIEKCEFLITVCHAPIEFTSSYRKHYFCFWTPIFINRRNEDSINEQSHIVQIEVLMFKDTLNFLFWFKHILFRKRLCTTYIVMISIHKDTNDIPVFHVTAH